MKKKMRDCFASLAMTSGISAVPLIIALVLLISLGAFFISLMLGKHVGAPLLAQSTKALYIAEAGIEFTAIYLRGFAGDADWTDGISNIASTSFGDGNFAVAFTNKTPDSVTATSIGTISNARRDISTKFTRLAVLMSNPVNWVTTIELKNDVNINGSSCSPPDCNVPPSTSCPCTNGVTLAQAPPSDQPTGVTWSELEISGGTYTFNAGTYYFDELRIKNGAVVTVNGPATIWIQDKFKMGGSSQFNWSGSAANLLLLSAGGPEDPDPDFEIEDGAMFSGAIYGPNPEAEVEIKDAQIVGAIVGNEVELKDTTITFDSNAGINAMITASNWGEM